MIIVINCPATSVVVVDVAAVPFEPGPAHVPPEPFVVPAAPAVTSVTIEPAESVL